MTVKDSLYCKLNAGVDSDDIRSILTEAKEKLTDGTTALKLLVCVNQLVYKAVTQRTNCKSSANDIVQLCELCCSTIISNWVPSIEKTRIYGCLYHVVNYLMIKGNTEYVNKICSYIFAISEVSKEKEDENEKKMLQNFILLLTNKIGKSCKEYCQFLLDKSERSLLTFCKLICKIDSLCDYSNNGTFLTLLLRISQFCNSSEQTDLLTFQKECLNLLTPKTVTDIGKLLPFLYSTLTNIPQNDYNFLFEYIKTFQNSVNDNDKTLFSLFSYVLTFLTCKSEEVLLQAVVKCNVLLKGLHSSNEINSAIASSCSCAVAVILKTHNNWIKQITNLNFTACSLQLILDFFSNLYDVLKVQQCDLCILPSGEKCLLKVNAMSLISCQYLILDLISFCRKNFNDILNKCYLKALNAQQESLHWLEQMKQLNCPKLPNASNWIFTGIVNYTRSVMSSQDELEFVTSAFKYMLSLPREIIHTPEFTVKASCLIACLSNILQKSGKLNESLIVLTAFLTVWPESGVTMFKLWGDLKHNQSLTDHKEEIMNLTIYDIIKEKKEELERDWIVCNFSNTEIVNYLILEIQVYYKNSLLRGKPLLSAFNALRKLTGDTVLTGRALAMAMEVSSSSDKYSTELEKHLELSNKILPMLKKQALRKKDGNDCGLLQFLIGDILYQQFRCDLRLARSKSEREIILSASIYEARSNSKVTTCIEDINPNDKCDVNPVYSSISIKAQSILLMKIDEAVKQWEIASSKVTEKPEMIVLTLENICATALMFKLYYLEDKEMATWRLLYNVAKKFCDVDMKIAAVSELMDLDPDLPSDWVQECREDIEKPNVQRNTKSAFEINFTKQYLLQKKFSECLPILKQGISEWHRSTVTYVSALLKMNNFQSILSGINMDGYLPSDIVGLQEALGLCLGYMLTDNEPRNFIQLSQIHDFGLQASYNLGIIYRKIKLPRQARCFLKSHISVVQKLALPLRTAQLLSILTWIDLDCGNTTDACVKLEGLEAILDVQHLEASTTQAYSSSSPSFQKSCNALPKFLSHVKLCKCFSCTNVEYQRLVLETVILRADYSILMGDKSNALSFFKVGIRICNELLGQKKISSAALKHSQVQLWLRYSNLQAMFQNYTEAIEANQKAKQLSDMKDFFTDFEIRHHMYNLKQLAQHNTISRKIPVKAKAMVMKNLKTPSKLDMKDFKTPDVFPRIFAVEKSPLSVVNGPITPVRPGRSLFFDSSDDDENENCKENRTTIQKKEKGKMRTPPKFVLHSPLTLFPSIKKERNVFSVFSDDGENLPSTVKKTYEKGQIKKKPGADESLPAINVIESKKKLFSNDINNKSNSKTRCVTKSSFKVLVKDARSNKTSGLSKPSTSTSQVPTLTRACLRSRKNLTEDKFSFAEMESALNDTTNSSSTSIIEATPPKPTKRVLKRAQKCPKIKTHN